MLVRRALRRLRSSTQSLRSAGGMDGARRAPGSAEPHAAAAGSERRGNAGPGPVAGEMKKFPLISDLTQPDQP